MPDISPRAFFLVGPTAAGKTAVAQRLAERRQADILSADSMLVYRGMDIGTAKPSFSERLGVRYWGVDVLEPSCSYNVAAFLAEARRCARASVDRGSPIIVVGGTGLYVKALQDGLEEFPEIDPGRRVYWQTLYEKEGLAGLQTALENFNPVWLNSLADRSNARRLIRALELAEAGVSQPPKSWQQHKWLPPLTGLELPRDLLHERIAKRVRNMYENGLLQEVEALLNKGWNASGTAAQAIGYAEAIACLKGVLTPAVAMERTVIRTRQLAKRQMTWFRHQANVRWITVRLGMSVDDVADRVSCEWESSGPQTLSLDG